MKNDSGGDGTATVAKRPKRVRRNYRAEMDERTRRERDLIKALVRPEMDMPGTWEPGTSAMDWLRRGAEHYNAAMRVRASAADEAGDPWGPDGALELIAAQTATAIAAVLVEMGSEDRVDARVERSNREAFAKAEAMIANMRADFTGGEPCDCPRCRGSNN